MKTFWLIGLAVLFSFTLFGGLHLANLMGEGAGETKGWHDAYNYFRSHGFAGVALGSEEGKDPSRCWRADRDGDFREIPCPESHALIVCRWDTCPADFIIPRQQEIALYCDESGSEDGTDGCRVKLKKGETNDERTR